MDGLILFVCTGNVCRSAMAEALFGMAAPPGLPWRAASAGLFAADGAGASRFAKEAVRECGGDLSRHASRAVSRDMLQAAGVIVAMEQAHLDLLAGAAPGIRGRLFKIRAFESPAAAGPPAPDLPDPYGGTLADYRRCRDIIRRAMPGLIRFLQGREAPWPPASA